MNPVPATGGTRHSGGIDRPNQSPRDRVYTIVLRYTSSKSTV